MSKTTPGLINGNGANAVRTAVTVADSATINDSNFLPADAMAGVGWRSVLITPTFVGGTAPTVVVQVLRRAGSQWIAMESTVPMVAQQGVNVDVYGRDTFFRVSAVAGSPTSVTILCAGWEPFNYPGNQRG